MTLFHFLGTCADLNLVPELYLPSELKLGAHLNVVYFIVYHHSAVVGNFLSFFYNQQCINPISLQ